MIDRSSLPLTIGTVDAVVAIVGSAFVKLNTVVLQSVNQNLHSAGNFPLGIGVLNTKEQHTAALMAHTLGNCALNQVAQMDKAGGRGGHTGNYSALGKVSDRIACFYHFRGVSDMGKQQLRKCLEVPLLRCFQ